MIMGHKNRCLFEGSKAWLFCCCRSRTQIICLRQRNCIGKIKFRWELHFAKKVIVVRTSEEEEDDALSTKFAKKQRFALEKHGGAERPENKSVNIDGIDTQNTGNAA